MIRSVVLTMFLAATTVLAQDGWQQEGELKRWFGTEITSQYLGSMGIAGDPVVETGNSLLLVELVGKATTKKNKPEEGEWVFLPRVPHVVAKVDVRNDDAGVTFYDAWLGKKISEISITDPITHLQLDVTDTWIAGDGSQGCVVFSPTSTTPEEFEEYVIVFFANDKVTFTKRIKPKVDVDIYVRPHPEKGVIAYLRGNGISFPPSQEEIFTNASYLTYEPDGNLETISLPVRGPGSGTGRFIVWHSNKWDRLLLTDKFASGALLIKASNGIVVDSITKSKVDPGPVKILSASGNINDRWMSTHARVGDKNVLILWAMPDTREVASTEFKQSDVATKQMPLSPWSVVIPFISSGSNGNALYSWNSADVVGVENGEWRVENGEWSVWPMPASDVISVDSDGFAGGSRYFVMDITGNRVQTGEWRTQSGPFTIDVSGLASGIYVLVTATHRTRIVISR